MFGNLDLQTTWFLLIGVLLTGYALLDGFDLGVGSLHLLAKNDTDRRIILNSIGPVWDGNEVWLLTGGGALFAAFPDVYATVFSGFYIAFMLLLALLIFRAVAIEFRSKEPGAKWRNLWDTAFAYASMIIAVLMGVALGNVIIGLPLDEKFNYTGNFFSLLTPFPLVMGITTLALFTMHGAIYLSLKCPPGELRDKVAGWVKLSMLLFGLAFVLLTVATFIFAPRMTAKLMAQPWLFGLPVVMFLLLANVPREIHHKRDGFAFISSCLSIVCMLALVGIGLYPNIVPAQNEAFNMTVRNVSSNPYTLSVMLVIAIVGVPFVLAYTAGIYWVFRGRVDPAKLHY